jgi:hypothetical protein
VKLFKRIAKGALFGVCIFFGLLTLPTLIPCLMCGVAVDRLGLDENDHRKRN